MNKKLYIIPIAVIFLFFVGGELLIGKNSIPKQRQMFRKVANYEMQIDSLNQVIDRHKQEIERLKHDSLYKEKILRTHYGMSAQDEIVFQRVK